MGDSANHRDWHRGYADEHALALGLEPSLRDACLGCIGSVEWFRSAWQHSGAATGFCEWTEAGAQGKFPAIVKLPVGGVELNWSRRLGSGDDPPVARVLACGDSLQDLDIGWLVVEKLNGKPLSTHLDERAVHELIETAVEFHEAARHSHPVDEPAKEVNWESHIHRSREAVKDQGMSESQRWNEALHRVERSLPALVGKWRRRPIHTWCHGDLHPGNALRRRAPGHGEGSASGSANGSVGGTFGRCVLIDLAMVHSGHWVEDAVYLERQYWGHADLLHGVKPVTEFARLRRARGMAVDDDYADLANIRRVLMASLVPLFIEREGNAKYVHGALETLERVLPQVR